MKKLIGLLLVLSLLSAVAFAEAMTPASEFEGGKLYRAGKINVVVMQGNFYQMGRQYGALLKPEFKEFYDLASKKTGLGTEKAPFKDALAEAKEGLGKNPFYVREWVRGMGETSGLGAEKQIVASQLLGPIIFSRGACSGLIAWGEYTKDGSAVAGRNWDLPDKTLEPFQKFLTVAVFNPVGSGQGVADINYLGQIMWQSALNQSGLFYDLQNGGGGDPLTAKNRLNSNSALMSMMLDSTSFEQLDGFFDAVRAQGGIIINAAGAKQGACYEWGTFDYRRRVDDEKGLVASANHFVDPTWHASLNIPMGGKAAGFSLERCANLLVQGKKLKGRLDASKMKEIFDRTIPQGGPTFYEESGFKTFYTIVAVPKELTLWLNVRGLQDWTRIDLKEMFVK